MARGTRDIVKPTAQLASATQLKSPSDFARARKGNEWQKYGWDYYDLIGEYRYVCDWLGAMVGKVRLYAGKIVDGAVVEQTSGPAAEYVEGLFGGPASKAEVLRQLGIHFTVAGEAMILGTAREVGAGEFIDTGWYVAASTELNRTGPGQYTINGFKIESDAAHVTRVWRPHPAKYNQANSSTRAVLSVLHQLRTLDLHTMAQLNSRLAGAGIFVVSDQITLPAKPSQPKPGEPPETATQVAVSTADELMQQILDAMTASLTGEGTAATLVPIVITAPNEAIEAMKHITFWSELDEHSKEMRDDALARLGIGMDIPPEVITGNADSNHWAAWASDESGIKAHGEPLAQTILQALTAGMMWPVLKAEGLEDFDSYVIAGDTSAMRLRPNRSKEAFELHDRGAIGLEALRRETGFDESDAMDDAEYGQWLLLSVARGSTTPEQVENALRSLGADLPPSVGQAEPTEGVQPPSLLEHPIDGPPDQADSERRKVTRDQRNLAAAMSTGTDALHTAAWAAVHRAMERAGNRMRTRGGKVPGVTAVDHYRMKGDGGLPVDVLLEDAWDHLPRMCARLGVSVPSLQAALTAYCTELFETKAEIDDERLGEYLALVERG